jgi:hypothetical protein
MPYSSGGICVYESLHSLLAKHLFLIALDLFHWIPLIRNPPSDCLYYAVSDSTFARPPNNINPELRNKPIHVALPDECYININCSWQ